MSAADPIVGLKFYLDSEGVQNVYGSDIPDGILPDNAAVAIRGSGGLPDYGFLPVSRYRVDIRCYGPTPYEAMQNYLNVADLLKNLRASTQGDIKILSAVREGGPFEMQEPEVPQWPLVLSTWTVMCRDEVLSS